MVALGADVGAHPVQLVHEHEPALEHVLGHDARPVGRGEERHHLRLEVGRKPRIRERHEIDTAGTRTHRNRNTALGREDVRARVGELREHEVEVVARAPSSTTRPPSRTRRSRTCRPRPDPGSRCGPPGPNPSTPRPRSSVCRRRRSARPSPTGGPRDPRAPARARRSRSRSSPGPRRPPSAGSPSRRRSGSPGSRPRRGGPRRSPIRKPCSELEPRAHLLEPADVQVDRPRPDVAAAGHRHLAARTARAAGPGPGSRRASGSRARTASRPAGPRRRSRSRGRRRPTRDDPEVLEHLGHRDAVLDPRDVARVVRPSRRGAGRGHAA